MVCPATVTLAVRDDVEVLAVKLRPTDPDPVPLAPDVTVIQDALSDAVQAHAELVVTERLPVPPDDAGLNDPGATV